MKNIFIVLLFILYFFGFFYIKETNLIYSNLSKNIAFFEIIISSLNAIFLAILVFYLANILQNTIQKTATKIKNKVFGDLILKFLKISKYIISVYIGLQIASIPTKYEILIDNIFKVSFIITIIFLLNSFVETIFESLKTKENYNLNKHVIKIVKKVITIFIWLVGAITIIGNLGYNISALITGAGIGGLALALASQKSVANIFGAISILLNSPFKIGDSVKIGNISGTVKDIGVMYLKITDSNGHEINIPNETIITSPIENFSVRKGRKVDFSILIELKTPKEKIKKGLEIIEKFLEKLKKDEKIKSYRFAVDNFSTTGISIVGTFFSNNGDLEATNKLKEDFNLEVLEKFEKNEINII